MQDTAQTPTPAEEFIPRRRATDYDEQGNAITLQRSWERAGLAHARITELNHKVDALDSKCSSCALVKASVERAFLKDDLGTVDYEGHRQAHRTLVEQAKVMNGYKQDATKNVIKWATSFLFGALMVGLLQWIKEHMK